jgi:MerR family glutamine synthetase transcriptional repressor
MKLTDLTARQIRYYEQHELIQPMRTDGKQRLFSFNDVERLLEIKTLIEKGVNIAGIKQLLLVAKTEEKHVQEQEVKTAQMSDAQLHKMLKHQLQQGRRPGQVSLIQGELARFFKKAK